MKAFQQLQQQFAARIRDPEATPLPAGVEPGRMRVYEELFFNNLNDLLAGNFPVLHEVLEARWPAVIRAFMRLYRCHTPLFAEIPREFLAFLHEHAHALALPPFAEELAHYEWVEMGLAGAREDLQDLRRRQGLSQEGDVLEGVPVLSPLVWLLSYQWPVHEISREYQPETPLEHPIWLMVWRDGDNEVQFAWINETVVWLLQQLSARPAAGRTLVERLARHLGRQDVDALRAYTRSLLEDYLKRDVLLGVRS